MKYFVLHISILGNERVRMLMWFYIMQVGHGCLAIWYEEYFSVVLVCVYTVFLEAASVFVKLENCHNKYIVHCRYVIEV